MAATNCGIPGCDGQAPVGRECSSTGCTRGVHHFCCSGWYFAQGLPDPDNDWAYCWSCIKQKFPQRCVGSGEEGGNTGPSVNVQSSPSACRSGTYSWFPPLRNATIKKCAMVRAAKIFRNDGMRFTDFPIWEGGAERLRNGGFAGPRIKKRRKWGGFARCGTGDITAGHTQGMITKDSPLFAHRLV